MQSDLETVLPTAEDRDGKCLVTADGSPVWPLCGDDDRAALERLTTVFGGRLAHVPAREGVARHLSSEDVVALGPGNDSAAVLHAHLTRRRARSAHDLDALKQTECPSVVVTTPEHLSHELLDWLYSHSGGSAPGIICGERGAPLRRQVLLRAAAATLSGPLSMVRSDIFPTVSIAAIREDSSEVLGSEASASERRQALARGAGVLTIVTHSDGVDAFMGADLSVCGMGRVATDVGLSAAPRCRLTGFCHRHEVPVSQAVGSGAVLAPEEIAARVFVWSVCFGVMPTQSVVDPRWGIGVRLMESPAIGAILTSWQIVLGGPDDVGDMSQAIASGVPVGIALARFNASRVSRAHRHRMCLLGDPRVRLARHEDVGGRRIRERPAEPVHEPGPTRRGDRPPATDAEQLRAVALLRLCMTEARQSAPHGRRSAMASRALEAIEAFEAAAFQGLPIAALDPQVGNDMRAAVLDYALSRGKLLDSWMPFTRSFRPTMPSTCGVCGRQADTLEAIMRPPGVRARRVIVCPLCGVLEDAPATSSIRMELTGRRIRLHGTLPQQRWAAGILIASSYPADSAKVMWPASSDGTLAPSAEVPERWPPGPLRISTIILWDASFAVFSRMARGPIAGEAFTVEAAP